MNEREAQAKESPEKKTPCQVTVYVDEAVFKGTSIHFNERGMLVACQKPAALNTRVKLALSFPGMVHELEVLGDVVWTNVHGAADALSPRAMGIKFVNLDRDLERIMVELASQYESFSSIYTCYYT